MTTEADLTAARKAMGGCWEEPSSFPGDGIHYIDMQHALTGAIVSVTLVPPLGAAILEIENAQLSWTWTGHDLTKGLRDADECLTRCYRSR